MQSGRFDASRARESLEQSLRALNVDHVDILHLHDPEHAASVSEITGAGGALPELVRMKEEGLCKAIGLAAGRVDIMMPLLRDWDFDALISHNRYTLVNRNADSMFDLAQERGVTVLNAAPYAGGVFAKGSIEHPRYVYQQAGDAMLDPVRQIEALCARHQVPTGAVALQFSMRDARIASTICGVTKPERVEQTIAWATLDIPQALWEEFATLIPSYSDPEATRDYTSG
jgi:D-threo-aldose 1-dehydrogenase